MGTRWYRKTKFSLVLQSIPMVWGWFWLRQVMTLPPFTCLRQASWSARTVYASDCLTCQLLCCSSSLSERPVICWVINLNCNLDLHLVSEEGTCWNFICIWIVSAGILIPVRTWPPMCILGVTCIFIVLTQILIFLKELQIPGGCSFQGLQFVCRSNSRWSAIAQGFELISEILQLSSC